mgnify:CR=1 FL=1
MKMFSFEMMRNDKPVHSGFIAAKDEGAARQVASKIAMGFKSASRPDQVFVRESMLDDIRTVVLDAPQTQTYAENLYEIPFALRSSSSSIAACEGYIARDKRAFTLAKACGSYREQRKAECRLYTNRRRKEKIQKKIEVLNRDLIRAKQDSERYRKRLSVMEPVDFGDGCTDEACAMYMRHMRFDALARSADQAVTQLSAAINRLIGFPEEEVLLTACD